MIHEGDEEKARHEKAQTPGREASKIAKAETTKKAIKNEVHLCGLVASSYTVKHQCISIARAHVAHTPQSHESDFGGGPFLHVRLVRDEG